MSMHCQNIDWRCYLFFQDALLFVISFRDGFELTIHYKTQIEDGCVGLPLGPRVYVDVTS